MIWLDTWYPKKADETIDTVIVGSNKVLFIHFKNGYYSVIDNLMQLDSFMNGHTDSLRACFDTEEDMLLYLKAIENDIRPDKSTA